MRSRRASWGLGALTLLAVGAFAVTALQNRTRPPSPPGTARLHAIGSRTPAQLQSGTAAKLDATLAELARLAPSVRPGHELDDLHALSPAARLRRAPTDPEVLVSVDAVTRGEAAALRAALVGLGLQSPAVYANDVGGWLPVSALEAAVGRAEVHSLRAALSRARAGAVMTQGDFTQRSDLLRSAPYSLTGAGVSVGVLSDSFDCYAVYAQPGSGVPASGYAGYAENGFTATALNDRTSGDLPASVTVLAEADCPDYGAPQFTPFGDEGRAMLQIVHDVAPGAGLSFYTAENSEAGFANGILALANAGARVIADDVGYYDEPFFQDGIVAQAIDTVTAQGVAYFSAAGNEGDASYENTAPSFATASTFSFNAGELLLNVDGTGATTATALPVTIDPLVPGQYVAIVVEWDQPYVTGAPGSGGAASRIDVCVTGAGQDLVLNNQNQPVTCTGPNALHTDPYQVLVIANPANAAGTTPLTTLNLYVGLADGTVAPGRIKVVVETDGQSDPPLTSFATHSATVQGHAGAAGALSIAAAFYYQTPRCGYATALLEPYSSLGGTPILFDKAGARLATPLLRQKPDVVGPDGVNDTFLGFTLAGAGITGADGKLPTTIGQCQNAPGYPNFFGTSAATPHVAALAALMLQANTAATPAQIGAALRGGAAAMGGATPNFASGYGFVRADAAIALVPPGMPSLSLAANTIAVGGSTTLTWSSLNATGCTASGDWSGARAGSGTQTVSAQTAGTTTYTLTCANAAGTSAANSVTLTATTNSGGGGGVHWLGVLGLAGLWSVRRVREMLKITAKSR